MHGALVLRIDDPTVGSPSNPEYKIITAVGFDLEGTCIDLESLHHRAHRDVAKSIGITLPDSLDEVREHIPNFDGGPDRTIHEQILAYARKKLATIDPYWTVDRMLELKDAIF